VSVALITTRGVAPTRLGGLPWTEQRPAVAAGPLPVLLCLPPAPFGALFFTPFQALAAAAGLRVICVDPAGMGGADRPALPPSVEHHTLAIGDLLDQLKLPSVSVLGVQLGAAIATELALSQTSRVRSLVLAELQAGPSHPLRLATSRPQPLFEDADHLGNLWRQALKARPQGMTDDRLLALVLEPLRAGTAVGWGFEALFRYDWRRRLAALATPVLCPIYAEAGGSRGRAAVDLIPGVRAVELPGRPAHPFERVPDQLVSLIAPFVLQGV
jgi:pimeloyl-ACP methyl ester carboxylesterase